MNYFEPASDGEPSCWNLQTDGSGLMEQVLEYQFLASLTPELLRRGMRFEVLRADIDLYGHDLVVEADGIMRHIQLKGIVDGGRTREVPVNTLLAAKASGCVVWMNYDPADLSITGWRWFGGLPGEKLPHLGDRVAKHSRANRDGVKALRPHIRLLGAGRFTRIPDIAALADCLFGPASLVALRRHLDPRLIDAPSEPWLHTVCAGQFAAIPRDLGWDRSVELAHLIDGYRLAEALNLGDPTGYEGRQLEAAMQTGSWRGDAAELWVTLFLEHRRWRFSSPHEPGAEMRALLDTLVKQLREALTGEARR